MQPKVLALVAVLVASAFAAVLAAPPAHAATTDVTSQLTEYAGGTNALGGGSAVFVKFGTDAAFGVVYGNATHANDIYVVAIKARYLGVGQVYNTTGSLIAANHTIKIYTIYAAKLLDLIEYKDTNGNGVADYNTTYNGTTNSYTINPLTSDVFYKKVSLYTNWNATAAVETSGVGYRSWTFSLSATNLSYRNITTNAKLTGALPLIDFTFHLNASADIVDNVNVPNWKVTVSNVGGSYNVAGVTKLPDLTLANATFIHYNLKWDQKIVNWSYQKGNNAPMLLLTMGSLVTNFVPYTVVEGWIQANLVDQMGETGSGTYNYTAGNTTAQASVTNATGGYAAPRVLKSPLVDFGGNWTKIGRFLWTSNDTVDGVNSTVTAQIFGAWGFRTANERGDVFYGFVALLGLNYVGGATIVHDPTVQSDATTGLNFPPANPAGPIGGNAGLIAGIVILVVIILAAVFLLSRRKKEEPPVPPPPPSP